MERFNMIIPDGTFAKEIEQLRAMVAAVPGAVPPLPSLQSNQYVACSVHYSAGAEMNNCGMILLSMPTIHMGPALGTHYTAAAKIFSARDKEIIKLFAKLLYDSLANTGLRRSQYVCSDEIVLSTSWNKFLWPDILDHLEGTVTYGPITENMGHHGHLIQTFIYVPPWGKAAALSSLTVNDGTCHVDAALAHKAKDASSFKKVKGV